jgi:tetratricopeptide (TPR) repeat protein
MTEQAHHNAGSAATTSRLSPRQVFARATVLQRDGKLAEAATLYEELLRLSPDHVDALHNLGIIRIQQGRPAEAVGLIGRTVELAPESANPRNDLGMAFAMLRRYDEAAAQYQKALAIHPGFIGARGNLANTLVALNRPDEAIAQLELAIASAPRSAELRNNLGIALSNLGRHNEAISCFQAALTIRPDFPEAHNNLGIALAARGHHGQAEAHYAQAIALRANYVDALRNLGKALLARGRTRHALPHLSRALELRGDADAYNELGNALAMLDRNQEAIEHYQQALARNANFPAAYNNLGNTLATLGRHAEAVAEFRKALALVPDYPEALSNLGNALLSLHQLDEAVRCFDRALALRPDLPQAHFGRGGALQTLGRLDESREEIEQAIVHAPGNASYYHALCAVKRFTPGDPHLVAMQALARDMDALRPSDRVLLNFALGKAYADVGEHEPAFRHYAEGNAQHRAGIAYDEAFILAGFERIKQVFTADFVRSRAGGGEPSDVPIFIVGMPRSGTTLVEQILASQGQVHGAGELKDLGQLVASIRGADGKPGFPELVPAMSDAQLCDFGARYVAGVRKLAPTAARITDKMMGNFYFAGLIRLALPNARIIHLRRDPLDTCVSLFTHLFAGDLVWTSNLGEIGRYYRAYVSLMEHWHAVLPPGAILDVQYEDLVADLEPQARRIIDYCGLDWDDRCLSFHTNKRPVWTASLAQVRQPIYRTAVGRWRVYEPWLGPLVDTLAQP